MRIYNKLVRDNIPEIIRRSGETAHISFLDDASYLKELRKKLLEETNEFLENEEIVELADILEVIEALAKVKGSDLNEIMNLKSKKSVKNGAFDKKIFLESVE